MPATANDGANRKRVALKLLNGSTDERAKVEFLVEALLLAQFEHANVVKLEACLMQNEPPMIVSEFMENGQLDYYLRVSIAQQQWSCGLVVGS